jgi:hypothetical protein
MNGTSKSDLFNHFKYDIFTKGSYNNFNLHNKDLITKSLFSHCFFVINCIDVGMGRFNRSLKND